MKIARQQALLTALVISLVAVAPAAAHAARGGAITATAAIIIDRQTGNILWQRNPDLRLPPASTTKIVTGLLAIKSGRLSDSFPVSYEASQASPSKIGVRPGWRLRLHDLLYAILLNSANDASVVAAEGLGGSVDGFAQMMNSEARALGAVNSHFVNPNGLPAEDHYSTVRDLTTIFSAGLRHPLFRQVLETKRLVISPTTPANRKISLHSHNRLLMGDYPIHVIGKTGWTIAAKKCFVGAASSGGREILVAVLGSRDLWGDLKRMIDSGFRGETGGATLASNDVDWQLAADDPQPQASGDTDDGNASVQFRIRLGSFKAYASADRLRSAVAKGGYHALVARAGKGKKTRYHVTVGDYATREQAQRTAQALNRKHRVRATVLEVAA
ncbi:MAG TPA: D-alanyl-D-alanine carboxypeptidase [Candidatus Binatia bacterium]|nr:D-alanyl-D-alanine carboxypeptidase [Candidatus Binatia bacterium]